MVVVIVAVREGREGCKTSVATLYHVLLVTVDARVVVIQFYHNCRGIVNCAGRKDMDSISCGGSGSRRSRWGFFWLLLATAATVVDGGEKRSPFFLYSS